MTIPNPPFVQEKLPNGLTVVVEAMPHVKSVACGFLARTGSRDEPADLAGVSHFLEHMCFKGTPSRSSAELDIAFDEMGADNNAYTSKDQTFFYSWARAADFERQLELLADMMRSTLPADEVETERGVILNEIAMYQDDLSSIALDALYERMCAGSTLSWPIIGHDQTVRAITPDAMHGYLSRRYAPHNLVLAVAGRVEPDRVLGAVQRYCGTWEPAAEPDDARRPPTLQTGRCVQVREQFHQQAVMLAFPSTRVTDPRSESAEALAAILGGTNSRFYWNIVQKGLSTQAGVFHDEYADFGLFILSGLCEPENCERLVDAMRREAEAITTGGPELKELQRVKNLRRTSLAAECEAPSYRIMQVADDIDYRGAPRPAAERLAAVEAVSSESMADYLRAYPITGEGFLVSVGPRAWPTVP